MADASNGGSGRIVPIIMPRSNPDPMPLSVNEVEANGNGTEPLQQQEEELQKQELQQPSHKAASGRKPTRNGVVAEAESLEIPCLNELGLYALPTEGDGNCLYYALSDQLYGDFSHAEDIRIRLADHISSNPEYFMSFIAAAGGARRAPRRAAACAAKYASSSSQSRSPCSASPVPPPSSHDKEQSFHTKVAQSRKNGVWGGAEEIQACCQSYKKDVHVYTMYGVQTFRDVHASDGEEREVLHIAFHDFNHYSSVRHSEGPHTGMPDITQDRLQPKTKATPVVEVATPWKISAIQEGLGGKYDRGTIIEMLQQCRGNIDRAFCNLLGEEEPSLPPASAASTSTSGRAILKSKFHPTSRSSSPFSTASKRSADDADADADDDDDDDSEEDPQPAQRRRQRRRRHPSAAHPREHKRRILSDVTVGIAFRDDQNDLVSLRLRVSPDAVASQSGSGSGSASSRADDERADADSGVGLEHDKPASTTTTTTTTGTTATTATTGTASTASANSSQSSSQIESGKKLRRSRRLTRGVPQSQSQSLSSQ